jgi:hypothetical protein
MPFINCPNCAMAELRYTLAGQHVETTLWFYLTDPPVTQFYMDYLSDLLDQWWYDYIRPQQTNALAYRETFVRDMTTETGMTSTNADHEGQTGAYPSGNALPNNVTFCLSFRTGLAGRSCRGRNYHPGLSTGQVSGSTIGSNPRNALIAAYSRLLFGGGSDPTPWHWSVVSRFHDHQPREYGIHNRILTVVVTDDFVDSQRGRLPGRGT